MGRLTERDTYGHDVGDLVLHMVASTLGANVRKGRHRRPLGWRGVHRLLYDTGSECELAALAEN